MANVVIKYDIEGQQDIKDTTNDLEGLDKATDETQKSVSNFDKSAAGLGDTLSSLGDTLGVVNPQIAGIARSSIGAINGVKGLTTGFKALDTILKASVIGLILTTITALGVQLTKTAKGTEFLRKAFATLQGIGNALLDVFINLDKIFSRNIVDVFEKNIRLAREYAVQLRQNQINTRNLSAEIARLSNDYEIASQKADDATTSLKAQNEAALQAAKDLEELRRAETKLAGERLALLEKENEQIIAKGQERSQEFLNQLSEAQVAYETALTNETLAFLQSRQKIRQIDQDTFETRRDFLLDFTDTNKAINERIIADTTRPIEERFKILEQTRQFTENAFQKSLDLFEDQAGQRLDVNMLLKESDADVVFNYLQGTELSGQETQRFLELLRERNLEQQDLAEAERDLNKEREERTLKEQERRKEEEKAQKESIDRLSQANIDAVNKRLEAEKSLAIEKEKIRQSQISAEITSLNILLSATASFVNQQTAIGKSIALFQIGVSTAEAIAKGTAASQNVPFPGNLLATATTIATVLGNISQAKSVLSNTKDPTVQIQPVGAFKDGVIDLRGPGTMTSDSIPALLSDHESVIKGSATLKYTPALKAINEELVDPDLINGIATGKIDILDNTKVVEVPRTQINLDQNGFTQHIVSKANRTIIRRNRYRG